LNLYTCYNLKTSATITSLPDSGILFQLSHNSNKHGYDPKIGTPIVSVPCKVTGRNSRIIYQRPNYDRDLGTGQWGRFTYYSTDKEGESLDGTVVLVPPSGLVVGSSFLSSSEEWSTTGNQKNGVIHDRTSRGIMNHFIFATDDSLNINQVGNDIDVWYFKLPSKFLGWQSIVYRGQFKFDLSSFGGDFSKERQNPSKGLNIVEISCVKCNMNDGINIGFPLSETKGFDGTSKSFALNMTESSGWLKDPKNSLLEWKVLTQCEFIEVLSGISSIRILGDFTTWYECVSLDNVQLITSKPLKRFQVPICAQTTPDARRCTC